MGCSVDLRLMKLSVKGSVARWLGTLDQSLIAPEGAEGVGMRGRVRGTPAYQRTRFSCHSAAFTPACLHTCVHVFLKRRQGPRWGLPCISAAFQPGDLRSHACIYVRRGYCWWLYNGKVLSTVRSSNDVLSHAAGISIASSFATRSQSPQLTS